MPFLWYLKYRTTIKISLKKRLDLSQGYVASPQKALQVSCYAYCKPLSLFKSIDVVLALRFPKVKRHTTRYYGITKAHSLPRCSLNRYFIQKSEQFHALALIKLIWQMEQGLIYTLIVTIRKMFCTKWGVYLIDSKTLFSEIIKPLFH